jgi:hypothetical protein
MSLGTTPKELHDTLMRSTLDRPAKQARIDRLKWGVATLLVLATMVWIWMQI